MGVFSRGNKKFECTQDKSTGEVSCESFRENADGSRVPLASLKMQVDGMCNPIPESMVEHQDGELQELEKKVSSRMVGKCRKNMSSNKPADY